MMKYLRFTALFIAFAVHGSSYAQRAVSVTAELSGYFEAANDNAGMGMASLLVDARFGPGSGGPGIRVGIGGGTDNLVFGSATDYTVFPVAINYLYGKRRGFLEAGAGLIIVLYDDTPNGAGSNSDLSPNLTLGYRYQALKKGFCGRFFLGGAHFKGNNPRSALLPYLGFSFGYKFMAGGEKDSPKTE